jgi:Lrp/AsnC family leucine-responsive transcriptional regulator
LECHRVTGEDSYILRAALRNVTHLEELIDRLLPYGSPRTSLVLSTPLPLRNVGEPTGSAATNAPGRSLQGT